MSSPPNSRGCRLSRSLRWIACVGMLMFGGARLEAAEPFFFIQLSDPQFGMYAANANFEQETANFEFAIATVNRLKPAFVIVTGDLTNRAHDEPQSAEYLRIVGKLDPSIPLYQLPGNHDVGNEPSSDAIARYVERFGPDHYTFRSGSLVGIVLNSGLIQSAKLAPTEAAEQDAWLKAELEKAKQAGTPHIAVFQHHPWFTVSLDEPAGYHNLPLAARQRYLDLFQQFGVSHVFSGHHHANAVVKYGAVELVTTGAIGKPLRKDVSGLRVVIVRDDGIEHRFYHLGELPNRIDLSPPKQTPPSAAGK